VLKLHISKFLKGLVFEEPNKCYRTKLKQSQGNSDLEADCGTAPKRWESREPGAWGITGTHCHREIKIQRPGDMDARLTALLCKKNIVTKSKHVIRNAMAKRGLFCR
jgi:hypothetical protein